MALSPFYNWSEPDNSSLVKNGAADIRTLGDAIDTSVWNVGYGQAGKNKIINGDFGINQRAFSSTTSSNAYTYDRWLTNVADGTVTMSAQTFALGSAPVAGYEGKNYLRCVVSGQTLTTARANISEKIESVRTFAGQTVTVSFWAKAATGTPEIGMQLQQFFGAGGSPSASVNTTSKVTVSTSWARYSVTLTLPSIAGKTLGTDGNDCLNTQFWFSGGSSFTALSGGIGLQNNTFDIWGVQVEAGSFATPFQTASGGSPQAELAMCQRYYIRFTGGSLYSTYGLGYGSSTTEAYFTLGLPVTMRVNPTSLDYGNLAIVSQGTGIIAFSSLVFGTNTGASSQTTLYSTGSSGLTANRPYSLGNNNSTSGYLGLSAEL